MKIKQCLLEPKGLAKNLASRIVSELKDKVDGVFVNNPSNTEIIKNQDNALLADAISAMVNLGFSRFEAQKAVSQASSEPTNTETLDKLVAATLKELAS